MRLTLDHTQRLNLHALLGAQRADGGSIRAIWAIQDKLALSGDEESAIELRRECIDGQERTIWNPARRLDAREFDFTEAENSPYQGRGGNVESVRFRGKELTYLTVKLVANPPECRKAFRFAPLGGGRIFQTPVNSFRATGKNWTLITRVVADCNDVIELLPGKLVN